MTDTVKSALIAAGGVVFNACLGAWALWRQGRATEQKKDEAVRMAQDRWRAEFEKDVREELRADIERNRRDIEANQKLLAQISQDRDLWKQTAEEAIKDRDSWKQLYQKLWEDSGEMRLQYLQVTQERTALQQTVTQLTEKVAILEARLKQHEERAAKGMPC